MVTATVLALAFIDAFLGALAESYWIVLASAACGLCAVFSLLRDFNATEALLRSTLEGAEARGAARPSVSSMGLRIAQQVEALRYRSQTLSWEVGTLVRGSPRMQSKSPEVASSSRGASTPRGIEEVYQAYAARVRRDFRHVALAVGDRNGVVFSDGIKGDRFTKAFQQFFWPLFEGNSRAVLGLYDGFSEHRPFGGFGEFKIRWSLSASFCAGERETVVWLGYSAERAPTETEQMRFIVGVEDLAGEIRIAEERRQFTSRAKDAEQRSAQSSRMLAEVSHDIRSPLSNIKAVLNVIKLEGAGSDTPHLLEVAESNCVSMNDILESLIDFSRLQTGTLTPRTEEVSLSEVVKSVVQAFEVTARLKGISLSLETCPEMLEIRIDRVHVRRMLSNLVSNALKYTEHGEVTVRLLQKDLRASVSVTDTGRGMTREQQDQLFTPFARFHTEMAEGIGLGLALTRSLAELNQVDLVVDSEPAKGSTFTLVFKKPVTCVDADRAHGLSVGSQTPGRRIRILVVDDNRDSVETLSRSLELRGLEVVRAYSVTEALSTLGSVSKEISLDVIVSDVHMPKGGVEAILAHRALMDNPPAVIVLSGSVTSSQRLLKAGVRRVLLKPADLNELVIEIERAVTEAAKPLERAA